jgi:hypothetical protein
LGNFPSFLGKFRPFLGNFSPFLGNFRPFYVYFPAIFYSPRLGLTLLWLICGYGESPLRLFVWVCVQIALFAGVFLAGGMGACMAVAGWQWDRAKEESEAVRMVPNRGWQWQYWLSYGGVVEKKKKRCGFFFLEKKDHTGKKSVTAG